VSENPVTEPLARIVRWGWVFYMQLGRDRAFMRAGGMAYTTLVALVPMLILVFGVLSATGATEGHGTVVIADLFDQLVGEVPGVQDWLLPALHQVDLSTLGLVATAGLVVVAARLYLMVETAYNDIFGVPVRRSWTERMLNFYFTITAVPVLLVVMAASSEQVAADYGYSGFAAWVPLTLQYVLLVSALKLLPSIRVRWRAAFTGAAVSFGLLEVGRIGFSVYLGWFVSPENPIRIIYGSLALFPVFLGWVYLVWIFVLLGVEVANVYQNFTTLVDAELKQLDDRTSHYPSVENALQVMGWTALSFREGRGPITLNALHERCGMDRRVIRTILDVYEAADLVRAADDGWLVARPPERIPIAEVIEVWIDGTRHHEAVQDAITAEIRTKLAFEGSLADGVDRWLGRSGIRQLPDTGTDA